MYNRHTPRVKLWLWDALVLNRFPKRSTSYFKIKICYRISWTFHDWVNWVFRLIAKPSPVIKFFEPNGFPPVAKFPTDIFSINIYTKICFPYLMVVLPVIVILILWESSRKKDCSLHKENFEKLMLIERNIAYNQISQIKFYSEKCPLEKLPSRNEFDSNIYVNFQFHLRAHSISCLLLSSM